MWTHERARQGKDGVRLNFCYCYNGASSDPKSKAQRLFFWNEDKTFTGVVLFPPGKAVPYSRMKSLMEKLTADAKLRQLHQRALEFPLENHYSLWPSFPEELRTH